MKMSNICISSVTPNWHHTGDIRLTRLRTNDEILLYKEITWEICRLEASMHDTASSTQQQQQQQAVTSIKLIMNPSKIQIKLKKKLNGNISQHSY